MAYYGCHTDITIPYEELGSIRVIDDDGDMVSIIEKGRFVLSGTEKLNEPFEENKISFMRIKYLLGCFGLTEKGNLSRIYA